jgi:predicted Zn finger-like uncharacterized protein
LTVPEEGFYEMILTCPNCGTQYVVKDGAIPPQGRQVRCAACKHSWHQNPDDEQTDSAVDSGEPPPAMPLNAGTEMAMPEAHEDEPAVDQEARDEEESIAEATLIAPRSGPEAEERAYEESVIDPDVATEEARDDTPPPVDGDTAGEDEEEALEPASESTDSDVAPRATALMANLDAPPIEGTANDEFSPFAEREVVEPRGRGPVATVAILVLLIAAIAAAFWFLAPAEWKARVGLADAGKTPLELMITHPDRQKLASGQESLTVTGRVINPTDGTHTIPPIYAQLKSHTGKIIYSWTIAPPAPSLGPRASTPFNSTEVDVPAGGEDLTITLGAPKA